MSYRFVHFVGDSLDDGGVLQPAQILAFNSARGRRHVTWWRWKPVPFVWPYNARWHFEWPSLQRIASTMDLLAILHSHRIAHNVTSIAFLKRKKRNKRFNHLSESFVVSRVLYRFSAFEIYLRRSFAPGSLLNEVSERTGWTTEVHRVGVTSGSSIVIFEAYGGGSEFATASRRILPSLFPPWSILFSYNTFPGLDGVHARVCIRRPLQNSSLNAYAEYRRGQHDTMSLMVSCMSRQTYAE